MHPCMISNLQAPTMAHWYHLTKKSSNVKTGPIAVSTTSRDSCSPSCPLFGSGCYAETGPLRLHWDAVSDGPWRDKPRGTDIESFIASLRSLPEGSCFRHNQAGDLPHVNGLINAHALELITDACKERKLIAWTYTHHSVDNMNNTVLIKRSNNEGLTVNVSAHNQQQAADLHRKGLPSVCIVPKNETRKAWDHDGVKFLVCPAQWSDKNCAECKLCSVADRACVVAFKAHGTGSRKVESTLV
jgi:hypothetical protein